MHWKNVLLRGADYLWTYANGRRYMVVTEINNWGNEIFDNFYIKRKAPVSRSYRTDLNSTRTDLDSANTPEGARADTEGASFTGKVKQKNPKRKRFGRKKCQVLEKRQQKGKSINAEIFAKAFIKWFGLNESKGRSSEYVHASTDGENTYTLRVSDYEDNAATSSSTESSHRKSRSPPHWHSSSGASRESVCERQQTIVWMEPHNPQQKIGILKIIT